MLARDFATHFDVISSAQRRPCLQSPSHISAGLQPLNQRYIQRRPSVAQSKICGSQFFGRPKLLINQVQ
jgi:hypothetical protein